MKIEWASIHVSHLLCAQPMTLLAFLTPEHQAYLLAMALFVPFLLFVYWYVSKDEEGSDKFAGEDKAPEAGAKAERTGDEKLRASDSSGAAAAPQAAAPRTGAGKKPATKKPPANKSRKKRRH